MVDVDEINLSSEGIVEDSGTSENKPTKSGKVRKAKKDIEINLGKDGIFKLKKGEPIPAGVDKRFYSSLEREEII